MSLSGTDPDGYISDVVDRHDDRIASDFSQDFVDSTERLEKHFQDKYKILRNAYETRILKLSEVIEQTCSKLFSDELLTLLKSDSTSASFIPAHITEIISNQIHSENERYMQSILHKLSSLELEHSKSTQTISKLQTDLDKAQQELRVAEQNTSIIETLTNNLHNLERNYKEYVEKAEEELLVVRQSHDITLQNEKQLKIQLNNILHDNEEKTRYYESLKRRLTAKEKDIQILEYSFEKNSKDLINNENIQNNEHIIKKELKNTISKLTIDKNILYEENQELRMKLKYASDELDKQYNIINNKNTEENHNKQYIQELMKQIDILLHQEAIESNQSINIIYNKMKKFRLKLISALQSEKRLTGILQEELNTIKIKNNEYKNENTILINKENNYNTLLNIEKEKNISLLNEIKQENLKYNEIKLKLTEKEHETTEKENERIHFHNIINEYNKLKSIEIELINEKNILQRERVKLEETYQLQYENKVLKLNKEFNHKMNEKKVYNISKDEQYTEEAIEIYQNNILQLKKQCDILQEKHEIELNKQHTRLKLQYEQVITVMQERLEEASQNMTKLKAMVRDGKTVIKTQAHQLELMTEEVYTLQQQKQQYYDNSETSMMNRSTQDTQRNMIHSASNRRRSSILSTSSRASSTSPMRRSTTMSGGLSPAATAKEVHAHRMALLQRSVSAPPRGSTLPVKEDITTNSGSRGGRGQTTASAASSTRDIGSHQQTSSNRRSTISVLGTSHLQTSASVSGIFDPVESTGANQCNNAIASPPLSRRSSVSTSVLLGEATSPPASARSLPPSVRSSVSVLGDLSSPPNSARSATGNTELSSAVVVGSGGRNHTALLQAQEEARAAKRSAEQATANLTIFKDQVYRLEQEAKEYDESIRRLQAQIHAANSANTLFSSSNQPTTEIQSKEETSSEPSKLLLQKKTEEIKELQEKLALLKSEYDEQRQISGTTIAKLQLEYENSVDKCVHLSSQCEQLRREVDQKEASIIQIQNTSSTTAAYETSMLQMEENVQHHIELARFTSEELTEERQRLREMRKRESKLYKLIADIEKVYQREIHGLRQDLVHIRSTVESFESLTKIEIKRTLQGLAIQLQQIFQYNNENKEEEIKQIKIALSRAHTEEINALEVRFMEQIQLHTKKHAEELAQQHMELISQAESALGIDTTTITTTEEQLNASLDDDSLDRENGNAQSKTQRNVSFASDSKNMQQRSLSSSIDHSSSSRHQQQRHHTTLNSFGISQRNNHSIKDSSKLYDRNNKNGNYEHPPAYESVVSGLLEALVAEEMLDQTGSQQVVALAKAHQEPSFAAQAAARSILCSQLEVFVNNMHDRLSKAALSAHLDNSTSLNSTYSSGTTTMNKSSSSSAAVTAISYGADYSVFFD